MSDKRTIVRVPKGVILNDEDKAKLIAEAFLHRFRNQLKELRPDAPEKLAKGFADNMVQLANQCGEKHLVSDFSSQMKLTEPTDEECATIDELAKEVIEFRYDVELSNKKGIIRKAAGVIWRDFRKRLGLPPVEPARDEQFTSMAGPRV